MNFGWGKEVIDLWDDQHCSSSKFQYILIASLVPGPVVSCHVIMHLFFTITLRSRYYYCPHFINEDPEAQKDKITCPRRHRKISSWASFKAQAGWLQGLSFQPLCSRRLSRTKEGYTSCQLWVTQSTCPFPAGVRPFVFLCYAENKNLCGFSSDTGTLGLKWQIDLETLLWKMSPIDLISHPLSVYSMAVSIWAEEEAISRDWKRDLVYANMLMATMARVGVGLVLSNRLSHTVVGSLHPTQILGGRHSCPRLYMRRLR